MTWLLNIILPGTGLIIRRREWLGLSMAVVFALCGNVAIAGRLIATEAVPSWMTLAAMCLGAVTWLLAQVLCHRQARVLERMRQAMSELLREAQSALDAEDHAAARRALDSGLAVDEENPEVHVMRARLFARTGDGESEQMAWRRAIRLDRKGAFLEEARAALSAKT